MLKYLFCSIVVLLFACNSNDKAHEVPTYLIDEDTFVSILIEMHLADAVLEIEKTPKDSAATRTAAFQQNTFKKHEVTKEQYEKTMNYYKQNPEKFEKLYEKLFQKINILESELNN